MEQAGSDRHVPGLEGVVKRTKAILVRVSEQEHDRLYALADLRGMSMADVVRSLVSDEYRRAESRYGKPKVQK